ncbi:MAG: phage tail protein [candidate division KSB1 bacterium]
MKRKDPFGSFNFGIEIQSVLSGGFAEVSGLQMETEVEEIREGGRNEFVHKLPKRTKQSNLILKRGLLSLEAWSWYKDVVAGKVERKTGSVLLFDSVGAQVMRWNFDKAYPVKWTGPELRAIGNTVAFETLELAHNELSMAKP